MLSTTYWIVIYEYVIMIVKKICKLMSVDIITCISIIILILINNTSTHVIKIIILIM